MRYPVAYEKTIVVPSVEPQPPQVDPQIEGQRFGKLIRLGPDLCEIPERLLLYHARGQVLFVTGAGTSMDAGLPDFRELVLRVYEQLDKPTHRVLSGIPDQACNLWRPQRTETLVDTQLAEVERFVRGDYDVVLGLLERRIDGEATAASRVRSAVVEAIRERGSSPSSMHSSLIRLADWGEASTIVTTNFDLLLEAAAQKRRLRLRSHALGGIPRPSRQKTFAGILHIHGALPQRNSPSGELVFTDRDFGEFYLRRRIIPDFIHDAARLFNLVLVGYSANDAPMRYLLNSVAADGLRFADLKERFAFVGMTPPFDPVQLADWRGRGITPIPYESSNSHRVLGDSLRGWAELSPNAPQRNLSRTLRQIAATPRASASDNARDLLDYLVRRSSRSERLDIVRQLSSAGASPDWLTSVASVTRERRAEDQ